VVGRIVTIDHFGNLITDIPAEQVGRFERAAAELSGREVPLGEFYAEVPAGEAIALVSSFDTLEIAVRDGSAASAFAARRGQQVVLRSARPKSS
jgi:S-adenosylmethionine hydrolase